MRIVNKIKNGCLLVATCLGLASLTENAKAGLMTQTDTNGLAVFSTNTFQLYGDKTGTYTNGELTSGVSFIDGSKSTDLYCSVGGFFTNSTANASNVVFKINGTVDFAVWTNTVASVTMPIPGNTTNWVAAMFKISGALPGYGLRSIENVNAAAVTAAPNTLYFKAYGKNGL